MCHIYTELIQIIYAVRLSLCSKCFYSTYCMPLFCSCSNSLDGLAQKCLGFCRYRTCFKFKMYVSHAKQQACTFGITINKRSVVCSSFSLLRKIPNIEKRKKSWGMALLQNKLVYSVNLSIGFPQNHSRHCKAFIQVWIFSIGGMIKTILVIIETVLFRAVSSIQLILITRNHPAHPMSRGRCNR